MEFNKKELIMVFDQMTQNTEKRVLESLFTKEEIKAIQQQIVELKSEQSVRETTQNYRELLKQIGKSLLIK